MKIKQTVDKNNKSASFGIENNIPWVEFTAGKRDRVALYGFTQTLKKRIENEILSRGIAIPSDSREFLNLIPNVA